jgi:hypothetical protein
VLVKHGTSTELQLFQLYLTTHVTYGQCFFFLWGRRGTCTPKHFVNITEESKNFKMLELRVPLNIFLEKNHCLWTSRRYISKQNFKASIHVNYIFNSDFFKCVGLKHPKKIILYLWMKWKKHVWWTAVYSLHLPWDIGDSMW